MSAHTCAAALRAAALVTGALCMLPSAFAHGSQTTSTERGRAVYEERCALCHGAGGHGDGRMARLIKDPPPFDLTRSTGSDESIEAIVRLGGEAVGRSPRMPPWGDALQPAELQAVIDFVKTLRE